MLVNSQNATKCYSGEISYGAGITHEGNRMATRHPPRATLSKNLTALMQAKGWKQNALAAKSGVSQRTVSNMLDPQGPSPSLDNVDRVAAAFDLDGWHLIMPNLLDDLLNGTSITSKVLENLSHATRDGKEHILRVAEREAEYNAVPDK